MTFAHLSFVSSTADDYGSSLVEVNDAVVFGRFDLK